jgi:2,6-dihydroxypyridine 3-monooxygenase
MGRPDVRAIVIGGSLGGLLAALALRDVGCDVAIYERSPAPLIGQGAGIVVNPATVRYLLDHRLLDLDTVSVGVREVHYLSLDGAVVAARPSALRFTSYNVLYQGLVRAFGTQRYHLGHALASFTQDEHGVDVLLADGRAERCDLLIGADGIRSTIRRQLLPGLALSYGGYVAWRGTLGPGELSTATYSALRDSINYHLLREGGHFLTYPIPGGEHSGDLRPQLNWLWYRNLAPGPALQDLMTDVDGKLREVALPARAVQRRQVERLHADAALRLPPQFVEVAQRTAHPFIQAIADLEVPAMVFGRICLIGDAACVARPHVAAGTAKAAEDARLLGEWLDGGLSVPEALRRWEPGQLALGRSVVARARRAGQRVQFTGEWQVGEPLPIGLREVGDSEMPR